MAQNPTPKSKIAQLRRDIEQLDQKVAECTTDRPYQPRFGPVQDLKTERPTGSRRNAQGSLHSRLIPMPVPQDSPLLDLRTRKSVFESQIHQCKSSLPQLTSQLNDAKRRYEAEKTKLEVQHRMQIAKRKKELQSQEKDTELLSNHKKQLELDIKQSQEEFISTEETSKMTLSEAEMWTVMRNEYIAEREEVEGKIDHFCRRRDAFSLINSLFAFKCSHKTHSESDKLHSKLSSIEQQLTEIVTLGADLTTQKLLLQGEISSDFQHSLELETMEDRLNTEIALDHTIIEVNQENGFDIDEEILRIQVEIVEKRVKKMEKGHALDSVDLAERAVEQENDTKGEFFRQKSEELQKRQLHRMAAVSQWKSAAEELIRGKSVSNPASDASILTEIHRRHRFLRSDRKNPLEKLLNDYCESVKIRENDLQNEINQEKREKLANIVMNLEKNQEIRMGLQIEKVKLRSFLKEIEKKVGENENLEPEKSHPDYEIAENLVILAIYWDELVLKSVNNLHLLSKILKESTKTRELIDKTVQEKQQNLSSIHLQLRKAESKLTALGQGLKVTVPLPDESEVLQAEQAVMQCMGQVEDLEREVKALEVEESMEVSYMTPQIDPTASTDSGFGTLNKVRSNSELHGATSRSRSLLRTSVPRLQSKSPIDDHSPMLELLDLDDDLSQLMETQEDISPIKRQAANMTISDKEFYQRVMPLLEGGLMYKKYSKSNSLKQRAFDPLLVTELPPEACGYGIRTFRLTRSLREVEVKQELKSQPESVLTLDQIHGPLIPQATMTIVKTQKRLLKVHLPKSKSEETVRKYKEMKESGFVNVNSGVYEDMCRGCEYYPFSIVLQHSGRVEVIARTYQMFKTWVNGLNALLKRREDLQELSVRIKGTRRWV